MRSKLVPLASLLLAVTIGACASIMHGTTQDIGISSSPTGATVTVDNGAKAQTPFVAKLSRKDSHLVHIVADGYAPADLTLTKTVSGWVWGNLVFGGLIGLAVDAMSGGLYNLTPNQLSAALAKQSASIAPTKDGIYVIMVAEPEAGWQRVGQLKPAH
jgi:hypothetical protein